MKKESGPKTALEWPAEATHSIAPEHDTPPRFKCRIKGCPSRLASNGTDCALHSTKRATDDGQTSRPRPVHAYGRKHRTFTRAMQARPFSDNWDAGEEDIDDDVYEAAVVAGMRAERLRYRQANGRAE